MRALRLLFFVTGLFWSTGLVFGQVLPGGSTGTGGATVGESARIADDDLSSPRKTWTTFFDSMDADPPDLERARKCLDLSRESALVEASVGNELAIKLLAVLNRTKYVELDTVPDSKNASDFSLSLERSIGGVKELVGTITLSRNAVGEYRVSSESLDSLEAIWQRVKDWPVIGSLADVKPIDNSIARFVEEKAPAEMKAPALFGLKIWQWVAVPTSFLLAYLAGLIVRIALKMLIRLKSKAFGDWVSPTTLRDLGRSIGLIFSGWTLRLLAIQLGLSPDWQGIFFFVAEVAVTVGFFVLGLSLLELAVSRVTAQADRYGARAEKLVFPIVRNIGRVFVFILASFYFLWRVGFDVTTMIAGLGIGGLVFALAAKDSVENLFGSLTVLFDTPFKIGDYLRVDSIEGTVEEISIRSTRIRTVADTLIVVPNSKFIAASVENFGERRYRVIRTTIGVTYDTPPEKLEEFVRRLREMVAAHEHTWKDKLLIHLNDFGASSLNIQFYIYVQAPTFQDELDYREDILLNVIRIASDMGVDFAFPTQTLIIDSKNSRGFLDGGSVEP